MGHFYADEYHIQILMEEIEAELDVNPLHEREYDQKEIEAMKETLVKLKESYKYTAALSKLLDGDINFEDYKERVK